jgi:hypothetical protein
MNNLRPSAARAAARSVLPGKHPIKSTGDTLLTANASLEDDEFSSALLISEAVRQGGDERPHLGMFCCIAAKFLNVPAK